MSRNSSGTYTLPAGNPVVTGTVISSTWANSTLSDIATTLTDSLSRSGQGGMTAQLALFDGVIGAPGLSWSTEPTSGLYRAGAGDFRYSIAAADKLQITTNGVRTVDGAVGTPGFSFILDPDTGIYRIGANSIGFAVGGSLQFSVSGAVVTIGPQLQLSDGLVGSPGLGFTNDPDTGVWRSAANTLDFTTGAVNRVSLSATALASTVVFRGPDGTAGAPTFSFASDTDTGFYLQGAGNVRLALDGVPTINITSALLSIATTVQVQIGDGAVGTPAYSFVSDTDTGIYRDAANDLKFATGGVRALALDSSQNIRGNDGAVGAPYFSFFNDSDTGIYRTGGNSFAATAGGTFVAGFRDNGGGVTQTVFSDGSAAVPAISFNLDNDTGIFRSGANDMRVVAGAATGAIFQSTGMFVRASDGTAGGPSLSFLSDTATGLYRIGSNNLGVSTNGVLRWDISTTVVTSTLVRYGPNGAVGAPTYSFTNHTNGGIWSNNNNTIDISCTGVLAIQIQSAGTNTDIALGATSSSTMTINVTSSATANTGAAGAPPAQVVGYLAVTINGTARKIPYYAN